MTDVSVLGAGLQGALAALEIAERGNRVVIFDAAHDALMKASLHNEGKIHFGYVYAKDTSDKSVRLMAEGATRFSQLLDRWWPESDVLQTSSEGFDYLVLPDSLEDAEWLAKRYATIDEAVAERMAKSGRSNLGNRSFRPVSRLSQSTLKSRYNPETVSAAFETDERAIDLTRMAEMLRAALAAHPRIERRWDTKIAAVKERDVGGYDIVTEDGASDGPYAAVVNALWSDRIRIDATLGEVVTRPFTFRHKVANRIILPAPVPKGRSVTMVIGPFGDVVRLPSGSCYLSWYPKGCIRRTTGIAPPESWDTNAPEMLADVFAESVTELARRINGLDALVETAISKSSDPGVIFCWGNTDVDDPDSEFHERHDVGVNTLRPGYHSIDTGKLTVAPLFANDVANRIGNP